MRPVRWSLAWLALLATQVSAATLSVVVTDTSGAGVSEAVVYALPALGRASATAPRPGIIDQINKEFVPFVVPVQVGAAVTFPNKDNIRHHVYSFSPSKSFDLKLYSGVQTKPITFDKPGPVALGCNIHDWMVGYVFVVDSPWFAKTTKAGTATIELGEGEYDVRVWHPWQRAEIPTSHVKVGAPQTRLNLRIDLNPPPKAPVH